MRAFCGTHRPPLRPEKKREMSIFETVQAEKDSKGRWCVTSAFWSFPVEDEKTALRLCEVIRGAYRAGAEDLCDKLAALILPPMEA